MTTDPARKNTGQNRNVVALAYDGLCTFEFGIVAEIFGLPRPELEQDWYSFSTVSFEGGSLTASGGIQVQATGRPKDFRDAGTIVIPGWRGKDEPVSESLCTRIRQAYERGVRLVSICSGVYVLAAAGLLDGKRATTHWRYVQDLKVKFPAIDVEPDQLYVEQANIYSSAGSSAGIDVCLHIVRSDYGAEIANIIARRLVMHAHRQGGQSQFIDQPVPVEYEANRLSATIEYVRENLDKRHSVLSLSEIACMSSRTFQRRFVALVGMPVGKWLTQERISRACSLLETSNSSLAAISAAVGFTNVASLQYHFRNFLGVSPNQYRNRFSAMQ